MMYLLYLLYLHIKKNLHKNNLNKPQGAINKKDLFLEDRYKSNTAGRRLQICSTTYVVSVSYNLGLI